MVSMLESPSVGADTAVTADDRAALLVENSELRARIEAREQRIRLLEEALRILKASTYGPSRERLSVAAEQVGVSERAGLVHVGCFAHARRRFFEALKALPNAQRKQASAAHEVVRRVDALYLIERQIKDLSDEERMRIRAEEAVPQLKSLRE
jgi:Transposase IS66 family